MKKILTCLITSLALCSWAQPQFQGSVNVNVVIGGGGSASGTFALTNTTQTNLLGPGGMTNTTSATNLYSLNSVLTTTLLNLTNSATNAITLQTNSASTFGTAVANCAVLDIGRTNSLARWSVVAVTGTSPGAGVYWTNTWAALPTIPTIFYTMVDSTGDIATNFPYISSITQSNCVFGLKLAPIASHTWTNLFFLMQ